MAASDDDLMNEDLEGGSVSAEDLADEAEDNASSTIGSFAPSTSVGSGHGRATAKGKAKAKAKGLAEPSGTGGTRCGRPAKVKAGTKWCKACNKTLPIEQFPAGSAYCHLDKQAVQNIAHAAKSQGEGQWWANILDNPKKLQKVVKHYSQSCGIGPTKKKSGFKVAAYKEYLKQEDPTWAGAGVLPISKISGVAPLRNHLW